MNVSRIVVLFVTLLSGSALAADTLTIAVASNFRVTAREIAAQFTEETKIPVRISAGSTGSLFAQIVHGAPFDVFLAADARRPRFLEESGAAVAGSRVTYATGALVLWSADTALENHDCLEALNNGWYRRLAMANPLTAPYGFAAKEFLQAAGLFNALEKRIAYGENISQTLHFVVSGNATLGLIAKSQVQIGLPVTTSCSWDVPPSMHSALDQQAVLLAASENKAAAQRFMGFLQTAEAESILADHGYTVPD